jgi:copper resistance protein B
MRRPDAAPGKTVAWLLLALAMPALAQQHDHGAATAAVSAHDHTAAADAPNDTATTTSNDASQFADAVHMNMMEHGGAPNYLLLGERLERQVIDGEDSWLWEAQGWYGGDYRKLWVKTEGSYAASAAHIEHSELQLLYSRAVAPFWDLQLGLRHDEGDFESRDYAVAGLMGLAPYWFEVDAAAFISEKGKVSARVEAEYELRLTQKLLLQPRLELNHAFSDDQAAGVEQGAFDSSVGFRLRYEFVREFAPYVGIEWNLGSDGGRDDSRIVAGLRFWY